MKLILSRKGFDSGSGGCASPIFPDGSIISFPIPLPAAPHSMHAATRGNRHFLDRDILGDLTRRRRPSNRHSRRTRVHLDPYLTRYESTPADQCWRPAFGQDGTAQSHLQNERVGIGDLFLFFGWFRRVERCEEGWRYVVNSPDVHVLFGWLQIEQLLDEQSIRARSAVPLWLADHPHIVDARRMERGNTVYIATDRLVVGGRDLGPGGGTFERFGEHLRLTAPPEHARGRSFWQLPRWFHPDFDIAQPTLSAHRDSLRWCTRGFGEAHAGLQTVARGQEFVIDLKGKRRANAVKWLESVFQS